MAIAHTPIFKFFTSISAILIAFLLLRSYQLLYAVINASEISFTIIVRVIAIVAYFGLSYLTLSRYLLAAWGMVFVLGLSGAGNLIFGIVAVPASQYILKIFSIISGAYFTYGSAILFKSIRNDEMNPRKDNKTGAVPDDTL